jgi:transcription-repair coupling factor (superfamily II helicase)
MSLATLPRLLRDDAGLTQAFGNPTAVVAVPESARAITVAALAQLGERRPLLVATPTGTDAGQLYDDLCQYMPPDSVLLFPAWETLPFERVSPSVETMGRRMEVLWRLRRLQQHEHHDDGEPMRVIVAGVRALLQRLSPEAIEVEPIVVRPNAIVDPEDLLDRLIACGYRREDLVEHRGEVARRGAIIDVFPSTADAPVRIDLWGDEVDRLTEFTTSAAPRTSPRPASSQLASSSPARR